MRIEELIIEGFKSYPVRTQITGWDPSFNAITGLNGSGKSNILDAICFVLGSTNMSSMRAQNQQDLIYKRGQAGVSKASVTIVFDNSDRSKSPVGYEEYKQITVTRQIGLPNVSKYLLNGHKMQQNAMQTLFQSVQLNINNPNFVIMQGRITKVLNMRPQEILGMVEEAAGTRMFEERKDKAKKTMGKKEKKMQEIRSMLDEEITPKLEKLRKEKRSFIEYQKSVTEMERVERQLRALEWTEATRRVEDKQNEVLQAEGEVKQTQSEIKKANKDADAAEKEMEAVAKKRDAELAKGGKLKKLQEEAKELGKALTKVKTHVDLKKEGINDEKVKIKTLDAQLKESEAGLNEKQALADEVQRAYDKLKQEEDALTQKHASDEELLQTLLTGLSSSSNKNKGGGYMGQLADAKAKMAQAAAEEEQNRTKLNMNNLELKNLETKMKTFAKEAADNMKKLQTIQASVQACEKRLTDCGWSADKEKDLDMRLRQARQDVKDLGDQRERVKSKIGRLSFDYENPYPNFDRRKVKGVAAQLISLAQADHDKATALEIAGASKLFNVVVQDEQVGKDLITNGRLKKRVTFIPLNKIQAHTLPNQKLQAANRLAPGKVRTALSLVGYKEDVEKAIAYIFSDTLICDDADTAKRVTFAKDVYVRSVTIEGDVYDPSGTLSGGSAPNSSKILIQVQELLAIETHYNEACQRLAEVEHEDKATQNMRNTWRNLARDFDIKTHELKLLQQQVEGSNASLNASEVERVKATIDSLTEALKDAQQRQKDAKEECKKLEKDMEEFKNNKDGKIDELKASIAKQRKVLQEHATRFKAKQRELQTARLELEQTAGDIAGEKEQLEEAHAGLKRLHQELEDLRADVASKEIEHAKAEERLQEEMATLSRFDTELKELEQVAKEKKALAHNKELHVQELQHKIQGLNKEKTTAVNLVANLEKQHEWILEDQEQFGKPGTQYDFSSTDIGTLRHKYEELRNSQAGMKKKVNPKVMNMIDTVEKREASLSKMMSTVEKDKQKIEETIEELDRYKRDALQKTWEKVNTDFGGIFAELLPGNFAKLQPPEGQDLMDGLEVKVRLGTVWKQSLTELSGGQRSLIALSLIMALLQFKPAPMYILDEIDAALDLSHTQHIGQLFRTRFKGSQFIVVSLKEGLFTNANVLFRARFRDGTSIVERTAQRSTSALYNDEDDENERNPRRSRKAIA
ncbi:hypothetical protein CVT24_009207 [Panaeolus cyanescens]|uniref:Structural maintenance of chromosomes protein n=1 Tax=Panaeolus cyanescens TaxID=181874 RepID=A0A409Y8P1_9AGAR|nr:hypothetical protein CVT24_009207 [Panaeolus cyanescens]